jgi:tRNA_anti-like
MHKRYFFGICIILLLLASWGIYKVTMPHHNTSGEQAVGTLTATNLYNEFLKTENSANKEWVGKVIEVSGRISSVNESGNYISINLKGSTDGGVNCSFLKKDLDSENKYNAGDSITIKGKCTGFLMDVNLVDCVVKK